MAYLVTRAELARRAGVSAMAVTKRCAKELAPACVGNRVDIEHRSVVAWLKSRDRAWTTPPEQPLKEASGPTSPRRSDSPLPVELTIEPAGSASQSRSVDLSWTLGELVERFGSKDDRGASCPAALKDWLSCAKLVVDVQDKLIKTDEAQGNLISRELVQTHVFGAIENTFKRLLTDSPKNIARRIHGGVKSGQSVEESERVIRDMISSQLRLMKASAVRTLKDAAAK